MSIKISKDLSSAIISTKKVSAFVSTNPEAATSPSEPELVKIGSSDISSWGDSNNYPQTIIEKVEKNVPASSALNWAIKATYGQGIQTYKKQVNEIGKEQIIPVYIPEVEKFFADNDIEQYLFEQITDFWYFWNIFPEMILNKNADKIVTITSQEAAFCRLSVMNSSTKRIENCFISAKFPSASKNDIITVPIYNPAKPFAFKKFIYRTLFPTPGKTYYAKSPWHSSIDSGWLDIANSIPTFKKAMFENSMNIKYHIKIPYYYWEKKYNKWNTYTDKEKATYMKESLDDLKNFLSGEEKAGKAFISHFEVDKNSGKEYAGWQITPLDDNLKDGKLIPDSQEANAMILFSIGVDPSVIGAGLPGGQLGAGSGSDKRIAFDIFVATLPLIRRFILGPLYFVKQFNNWDTELQFGFKDVSVTTLDVNPTGSQKTIIN